MEVEILDKLNPIFKSVFGQTLNVRLSDSRENTSGWDSINHIVFLSQVEKEFGLKFTVDEVISFGSIELLVQCIASKL